MAPSLTSDVGNPTTQSATFEIWFKPNDLSGNEVLFEAGGGTDGTSFTLSDNTLQFTTTSGSQATTVQKTVTLSDTDGQDFIQAVGVINLDDSGNPRISFYRNGKKIGSTQHVLDFTKWSGTDAMGLGATAGNLGGNHGGMLNGYGAFAGQIAAFRIYPSVLSDSDVQNLYDAALLQSLVDYDARLDTDGDLVWENATGNSGMDLDMAAGSQPVCAANCCPTSSAWRSWSRP